LEGRYILKNKISQGGFGKVYLAIDKITKHEVVIKVNSEKDMNENEFSIMRSLSDKNISGFPKVYSQGLI
jgi:serine/threonine protein kinase